jgi:hypothetical protein
MINIMKRETAIALTAGLLAVVALGAVAYFMFFSKPSAAPVPQTGGQLSPTTLKGDINRDGSVDAMDAELIRSSTPCNHVDPCWNKVVGKTKDGDNPIYASDLDLNHDDNVNELDASAMSAE